MNLDPSTPGIDVSHFQGAIDWPAVAASGVRFCFLKATEGSRKVDPRFQRNRLGAGAAGLRCGFYHFFRPATPPATQAGLFLQVVGKLQPGDLPPVLDLEAPDAWADIPLAQRAPLALQWLETVESGLGATPLVYLSPAFAAGTLANSPALARFPLWIAHHTSAAAPDVPKPWDRWTFWQYADHGQIAGVSLSVDLDRFNGSLDDLAGCTPGGDTMGKR